jgi:large subunit ribosomal protein L9
MKVVLRSDIAGVGRRGDIVDVSDGHARNYLLPRGMAFAATPGAVNQANSMRKARDLRETADREAAQTVAGQLKDRTITITAKAGAEGRLFGSVTAADIADALSSQAGIEVDRKKVVSSRSVRSVPTQRSCASTPTSSAISPSTSLLAEVNRFLHRPSTGCDVYAQPYSQAIPRVTPLAVHSLMQAG